MAAIDWTDVTDHVPDLSTTPANVQTDILAFVNAELCVDELDGETGPKVKLARIYLAAHYATPAGSGSATSGPVSAESEGDVSVTYATTFSTTSTALGTTSHGQAYLALLYTAPLVRAPILL